MTTLYAVTVDTEEGWDWDAGWPVREHSLDNLNAVPRFFELCDRHGARTTWFTNWSVLAAPPSRDLVLQVGREESAELGLHIHPWLTPPHPEGRTYLERDSFLATYPEELAIAKLSSVHELFLAHGVRPTSFRGGRYSTSPAIQDFLLGNGFVADASIVPYTGWLYDGAPDYRQRGLEPRRIADAGGRFLWEIPLTLGFTRQPFRWWARLTERLSKRPFSLLRPIGILSRLGVVRRAWLNFEDTPAEDMLRLLEVIRPMQLPFVILTVHSSSLSPGGNPYSADEQAVDRIWSRVPTVLQRLQSWPEFVPATVSEIAHRLEAHHEDHRHLPPG